MARECVACRSRAVMARPERHEAERPCGYRLTVLERAEKRTLKALAIDHHGVLGKGDGGDIRRDAELTLADTRSLRVIRVEMGQE